MAYEEGVDLESPTEQKDDPKSQLQVPEAGEYPSDQTSGQRRSSRNLKDKKETAQKVPYYKLFSFADAIDWVLMLMGSVAAVATGVSMPLMTVIFGEVVNSFGATTDSKEVVHAVSKVSLTFLYLAVGSGIAAFIQVTCWVVTGERQSARIRGLYLKALLRQEIGFFDNETNAGEVVGRMSGDTVLIQAAMGDMVGKFIQYTATFIGAFVVAFFKGWLLTLVMLSSIPALVLSGAILGRTLEKLASNGQYAYSEAATVVEQTIGSIRTVASFTGEKQAIAKYKESLSKAYKVSVQEGLASGLGFGVVLFIVFCTYALAVWFGGKMILKKGYTGGNIITVIFAVVSGSMALGRTSPCISALAAGQAAAVKLFEAIKRKPLIDACNPSGRKLADIHGEIELRDVYFSYPARPNEQIFSGFSLSIPSGTTAALVGESGSGKSTVISLIERFYDPDVGEVLIDGINLKEFQLSWIRKKIGLVSQEPVLFTSSIADNIAYSKDGATAEEIRAAAEVANAAQFIDQLPQGVDTMVGENGIQLSGGQKQRVAIARAILKDPRILLLDEATSALDAKSERIVQEALDRIMVNRTTIVVAHRLSTVKNADTIAVIHHGKIVEKGSHSELVKDPGGAYCQLVRLQERSTVSEQSEEFDLNLSYTLGEIGKNSSGHKSFRRSISRGSSNGSTSHLSFSFPLHLPAAVDIVQIEHEEPNKDPGPDPIKFPPTISLRRVACLNKPEALVLLLGTIAAVGNGVILPIFGMVLSSVIRTFYEPADELRRGIEFWAFIFVILGLTSFLTHPLRSYFFAVAGCKLIERVRSMCFEKVVHMEISWFDLVEHSSGAIGARLSTDAAILKGLVGEALGFVVQNIATAVSALAIAFVASWELTFIILALLPFFSVNSYVQMKYIKGFSADTKKLYEEASQVANDAVRSIRTVASFCTEEKVMDLYQRKCEGPLRTGIRQGLACGIGFGVSQFFLYAVYACSFYAGAQLVQHGRTTFGDTFRVFYALTMASIGFSESSTRVVDLIKGKGMAASIFDILDRKSKIDSGDDSGKTVENLEGEIKLQHVSFRYPTRPSVQIFEDLCLTIPCRKTVALVGESGSGKSTVISLLQRFYDPDAGSITLDGSDIRYFNLKWLRHQMGLVSQEPVLFNDTIRANIAYGKDGEATEAEVIAAAELANAHNFIGSLQHGYDTVVGERGIQLSGGQKQRVAIARAIVKAPKILLLDEATSALDAESERVVQDALDRVMVNRTTVVVAHHLMTIRGADLIAVVRNGAIAEKGKHESLIKIEGGVYASLVALHTSFASE